MKTQAGAQILLRLTASCAPPAAHDSEPLIA